MQIELSEERLAQLNEYARQNGQNAAEALDEVLADALDWDHFESEASLDGLREGLADMDAGRTQPAEEVFEELRQIYGFPR